MSYKSERYNIPKLPGQSLAVTQCGLTICDRSHSCGPLIYGHYSAHFIIEGKGVYISNGKTVPLHAGQGFMIIPNIPNTYIADDKEPWKYIYANFSGADDETLVHNSGLDEENMTFDFVLSEGMLSDLKKMHQAGKDLDARGYDVTGFFLLVMSRLVRSNSNLGKGALLPDHYVRRAISYIEDNYHEDISVSEIASYVGIDRTYLYRIFIKDLGISPSKFLLSYRLDRAKALMEHKNISLSEIAISTGFSDPSHFSKAFSSKFGCSPGKYRNDHF